MDKKTKLWLGVGVVGVGAYLLFKSKKTTPALSPAAAPAKFVGADSFASVGENQKFTNMAGVGDRMIAADGGKFASVGTNYRPVSGGMINSTDVVGAKAGSKNSGIFANQPFTGNVANLVGANGDKVFANQTGISENTAGSWMDNGNWMAEGNKMSGGGKTGSVYAYDLGGEFVNQSGSFFDPRTARYGQNEGVFAPKKKPMPIRRTLPVEPNRPMPVTQPAPLNNLVGQDGSRFFSVHDGFGK
jgi:hypothetical protein